MRRFPVVIAATVALSGAAALAWQKAAPLPAPYSTPTVANPPKMIERPAGAELTVPAGFTASLYADGFQKPRFLAEGPGGEVLVTDAVPKGTVYVLLDKDRDQKVDEKKPLIEGLDRPYGMAFWKDYLYVTEATALKRYKYDAKAMTVGAAEEVVPLKDFGTGHWTRAVAFDKDKMYVAIGSSSNVNAGDPPMRAAVNRFNPDGSGHEVVASGLRNPVGLRLYPGSNTLWTTVQERDGLGDELVPDYFTSLRPGGFYGWPEAYIGSNIEPRIKESDRRQDMINRALTPDVVLQPHAAVMDFIFYTGRQFPAEYRGGAFLALRGSSNRTQRVGYSIQFVPFKGGKPSGAPRDFLTGYMLGPDKKEVWGRPVGLAQLRDGSVLLSEDGGKTIWRIAYTGQAAGSRSGD